jgi:mannosyl-oligosaccharide alpha-1,2-mannosidase
LAAWVKAQDRYGILPEAFDPGDWSVRAPTNALRPELADSAFTMWLHDHDEQWRHVARTHFLNMKRWNKAAHGYSGLADVAARPPAFDDSCPAYWWSEQMKYYWLIFSDCPRFDYQNNYLSTEGNVLKGLKRP